MRKIRRGLVCMVVLATIFSCVGVAAPLEGTSSVHRELRDFWGEFYYKALSDSEVVYEVKNKKGENITEDFYEDTFSFRIGSYSEPVLKFLTQDMGNDVTNLKIVDRVRSTQVSSNGIDLQVDYYFDLYGDYYDEVEVITKPNTYLNRHGFSTKCNGESLDTIVMEPLIPEDEKEN